jgi:hypothetical protein
VGSVTPGLGLVLDRGLSKVRYLLRNIAMEQDLQQAILQFNQDALKKELTAALIIQDQFHALTEEMAELYHSKATEELKKRVDNSVKEAIKGMLQAESAEIFRIHHHRLQQLWLWMLKKLAVLTELDAEKVLYNYIYISYLRRKISTENEEEKKELMLQLIKEKNQNESELPTLASFALIQENLQIMKNIRSYLPEAKDQKKLLSSLTWLGIGILLTILSVSLGFAIPTLLVGLVLGSISMVYGMMDFVQESIELHSEVSSLELGKRTLSQDTIRECKEVEKEIAGLTEDRTFLEQQELSEKHWSTEKKWIRGLEYAVGFTGVALAGLGLAFLFPIGIPLAALIVVAALSIVVTAFTVALWTNKVVSEQNKLKELQQQVGEELKTDEEMINKTTLVKDEQAKLARDGSVISEIEKQLQKRKDLSLAKKDPEPQVEKDESLGKTAVEGEGEGEGEAEGEGEGDSPSDGKESNKNVLGS